MASVRRKVAVLACTTIFVALIWYFAVIPQIEKMPYNFHLYMEQDGIDQIATSEQGQLSEPFKLRESLMQKTINHDGSYSTISSVISGINDLTDQEIFHSDENYDINIYDYTYKNEPSKQFWFKPGVQKQNYMFYHPLVFANTPLTYQRTDKVEDLDVYVFEATTTQNDISDRFPQFTGVKILSDTVSHFWVEPTTGDLIKFEKTWEDYTMDGGQKTIIQKGGKTTTDYSIFILSQATKARIENINLYTKIVPGLLISLTIGINLIVMMRDKIKQLNERIQKSERFAIVGTFTARLVHDLRNSLTVLKSQIGIMAHEVDKNEKTANEIARMTTAVDRMDRQMNEVVDFVKNKHIKFERFSSQKLIDSALQNTSIPEGIQIITPESDISISGDFTQLETALSNLIINSIQAINGTNHGTITLSIKEQEDIIKISVTDSGPGISKENMSKIFDAMYTTKKSGTGLGLTSCQAIMKNHGGKITVQNNPTTFTLHLPKKQISTQIRNT